MPETTILFYKEADGSIPLLQWLEEKLKNNEEVYTRCHAMITYLGQVGHAIRRPAADFLRDGIYELRIKVCGDNYRLLYFYSGKHEITLSHCFLKPGAKVDPSEINLAIERKKLVELDPVTYKH